MEPDYCVKQGTSVINCFNCHCIFCRSFRIDKIRNIPVPDDVSSHTCDDLKADNDENLKKVSVICFLNT